MNNDLKNRLFREFQSESDRGCAVLTVCLLEEMLANVFAKVLPEGRTAARDFMPRGRLSAGVKNARALGLLAEPNLTNLSLIIKIRNEFAHRLLDGLSFESTEIRSRCLALKVGNLDGVSKRTKEEIENISRVRYMHVFGFEVANLERLAKIASRLSVYEALPMYSFEV